jgi:site-specific recombinase XerD
MHDLILLDTLQPGTLIDYAEREHESVKRYQANEKAQSTRRAYTSDARAFTAFCRARGLCELPATPDTVCLFLSWSADAGLSPSSIGRRIAAISYAHELAGLESPTGAKAVKVTIAGIRNTLGVAPKKKVAATHDIIQRLLDVCPDTMIGLRDRALISLGFAMAARRSELAALRVDDLELTDDGYRVTIRKSKTDQAQLGQTIPVPRGYRLKPVAATLSWLQAAQITEGHVFRQCHRSGAVRASGLSGAAIVDVVKQRAAQAGLDPTQFAGHSLRSGFLTSAAESGATVFAMTSVSRHKSIDVLAGYVRSAELFKNPAGQAFL